MAAGTNCNPSDDNYVLNPQHREHLVSEGFKPEDINWLLHQGIRSISADEAKSLGVTFQGEGIAGLYFPFDQDFGQVRADNPPWNTHRGRPKQAKYISQSGKGISRAWRPELNNGSALDLATPFTVVTEGWKDAAMGTLYGRTETLAIAGVSHWRSALLERKIKPHVIIYDADAKTNPQVLQQLIQAGNAVGARIQFVPEVPGQSKAGVGDWIHYLRGLGRSDSDISQIYRGLLEDAVKPEDLLYHILCLANDLDHKQRSRLQRQVVRLSILEFGAQVREEIARFLVENGWCKEKTIKAWVADFQRRRWMAKYGAKWMVGPEMPATRLLQDFFKDGPEHSDYLLLNGTWRHWEPKLGYWEPIDEIQLYAKVQRHLSRYWKILPSGGMTHPFDSDSAFKQAMNSCSRVLAGVKMPDHPKIAFRNGTLDPQTHEFKQRHEKADLCVRRIDADYRSDVHECPEPLKSFIASSYGADMEQVIRMLIWWLIDPTAPYGKFLMLVGGSGSGKGVLSRFLEELLPDELVSSPTNPMDLNDQDKRHQILGGKQLCTFKDLANTYLKGMGGFYELVDNGLVSGRALHSSTAYSIYWNCRFILGATQHLAVENANEGWKRRCFTLPTLGRAPENPDRHLGEKLIECQGDAIAWALSMPREEAVNIYEHPESVSERMRESQLEAEANADIVSQFADECLKFAPDYTLPTADTYMCFKAYCKAMGNRTEMSRRGFNQRLRTHLNPGIQDPVRRRVRDSKNPQHVFRHIDLVDGLFRLPADMDSPMAEATCYAEKLSCGGVYEIRQGFASLQAKARQIFNEEQPATGADHPGCAVSVPQVDLRHTLRHSEKPVPDRLCAAVPQVPQEIYAHMNEKNSGIDFFFSHVTENLEAQAAQRHKASPQPASGRAASCAATEEAAQKPIQALPKTAFNTKRENPGHSYNLPKGAQFLKDGEIVTDGMGRTLQTGSRIRVTTREYWLPGSVKEKTFEGTVMSLYSYQGVHYAGVRLDDEKSMGGTRPASFPSKSLFLL